MRAIAPAVAVALVAIACGGHGSGHKARAATASPTPTPAAAVAAMKARCFGAAARDPSRRPCDDPPLNATAVARPGDPDHSAGCRALEPEGLLAPCAFGVSAPQASLQFALIGDSHAAHLRSAFEVVAKAQRWRGYQVYRDSCSFVPVGRPLPEPYFSRCARFKRELPGWLARHPEITTVFVVGLTRDSGVPGGSAADPFAAQVAGELAEWKTLPPTVKHLVVVRDTPEIQDGTLACVTNALSHGGSSAAQACAVDRQVALHPDPAATAATQAGVPAIDLTRFFCDDQKCFPVIGGVVAYKDITHLTATFSATLGPYLLDEVRRVAAAW